MKNKKTLILTLFIAGSNITQAQDWTNSNGTATQKIHRTGKIGVGTTFVPDNSTLAWYGAIPGPQLDVWAQNSLGASVGNSIFLESFSGSVGPVNSSNWIRNSKWLRRSGSATPYGWSGVGLHDGISIDASFITPGTNTKTWWERNPSTDLQTWGNDANTYMRLAHGKLALGTYYNPDDANLWCSPALSPQMEVLSQNSLGTAQGNFALISSYSAPTEIANSSSWFRHNNWLVRHTAGPGWGNVFLRDGLSIDASFKDASTGNCDVKTWWNRDPYNDSQSWGTGIQTYMSIKQGKVRIGTKAADPAGVHNDALLSVYGKVIATSFYVTTAPGIWADYVFDKNYKLMSINETESYVKKFKHLPGVPSAKEVEANGINLAETNIQLLEKLEEAYLHIMELNKRVESLEVKNASK